LLSTLLILVVVALLLPAVFDLRAHMGMANLVFTLITHRDVFAVDEPSETAA